MNNSIIVKVAIQWEQLVLQHLHVLSIEVYIQTVVWFMLAIK